MGSEIITDRGLETSQARYRDLRGSTKFCIRRSRIVCATTSRLDNFDVQDDCSRLVSALFFKRFLKRPFQIASIIPSSKALVERVASKMDFSQPRVIAEYGPGEGVHSREIARRMCPDSQSSSVRTGPSVRARSGTPVRRRPACPRDSWRCSLVATRTETSRH